MTLKIVISLGIILFPFVLPTNAADYSGEVVGIIDGDKIKVMYNRKAERIRLHGIDCPEKGQAFGKIGKWATSAWCSGER